MNRAGGPVMKQFASGLTDVGRIREGNEDAFMFDDKLGLYVVCDGLGGHAAGEVASKIASESIFDDLRDRHDVLKRYAKDPSPENRHEAMSLCESAVQSACKAVYDKAREETKYMGMSTTCILLAIAGDNALLAHVGASRAYLIRRKTAWQMTEDHSLGLEEFRSGQIPPDEIGKDIYGTVMTRCLGHYPSVDVDLMNLELMPDDRLILCSDGLSDYLSAREISGIALENATPDVPQAMVDKANEKGGKDNITCIAVEVTGERSNPDTIDAEQKIHVLRQIPLFESLGFVELVKVLNILHIRKVGAGENVIKEGEASSRFFVILDGGAEIRRQGETVAELAPGDFFGEMGLLDDSPRSADVVTTEPTHLLVIHRDDFNTLLHDQLQLSQKVLWSFCRVLTIRLRDTNESLS